MQNTIVTINGKEYTTEYAPLWWQLQGLQKTASGYGKKIETVHKVMYNGRKYRIYCGIFSNVGTTYIIVGGNKIIVY